MKNIIDDFHWKSADFLCKNFNTILLPEFGVKNMTSKKNRLNKKIAKDMLSLRHYAFKCKLKHKAKMYGRLLLIVTENLTSKTCGKCGEVNNVKGNKIYICKYCDYKVDRDINAARNILIRTCNILHEI